MLADLSSEKENTMTANVSFGFQTPSKKRRQSLHQMAMTSAQKKAMQGNTPSKTTNR